MPYYRGAPALRPARGAGDGVIMAVDMSDDEAAAGPGQVRAGATNSPVDVAGIRVGHAQRIGDGWRTGVTVVLTGRDGMACGGDRRGGAPGPPATRLAAP